VGSDAVTAATQAVQGAANGAAQGAAAAVSGASAAASTGAAAAVSGASTVAPTGAALVLAKLSWFIVVPGFYLALAFFLVAIIWRLVVVFRAPSAPYQLAIYPAPKSSFLAGLRDAFCMPQILKREPLFWVFLVMFHLGAIGIILGHIDILPQVAIISKKSRDMLGGGLFGVMVTLPIFYFIGRRFRSPVREISTPGDYILLLLLLFTFLIGDLMSWGNSWTQTGFVMTKADFARYFDGLLKFKFEDPRTYLHGTHYHFLTLHLLLAECVFVTLPFSKIVHTFLALPVNIVRRHVWTRN
jgi:nitrate reductase gamma subunit